MIIALAYIAIGCCFMICYIFHKQVKSYQEELDRWRNSSLEKTKLISDLLDKIKKLEIDGDEWKY